MTREEIEELKGLAASMGLYDDKDPCKRAKILGKAIKTLEQEPCDDCISRADAINAMSNAIKRVFLDHKDIAEKAMNKLPSVTPQLKMEPWILEIED